MIKLSKPQNKVVVSMGRDADDRRNKYDDEWSELIIERPYKK